MRAQEEGGISRLFNGVHVVEVFMRHIVYGWELMSPSWSGLCL